MFVDTTFFCLVITILCKHARDWAYEEPSSVVCHVKDNNGIADSRNVPISGKQELVFCSFAVLYNWLDQLITGVCHQQHWSLTAPSAQTHSLCIPNNPNL